MNNQLNIFDKINHIVNVDKMISKFYLNGLGEPLPWEEEDYKKSLENTNDPKLF